MTLHIELRTFPMHLQCISEALPHTLMHCVSDSACYTTLHRPLHLRLHTCHLCLFVCLFTFVTGVTLGSPRYGQGLLGPADIRSATRLPPQPPGPPGVPLAIWG